MLQELISLHPDIDSCCNYHKQPIRNQKHPINQQNITAPMILWTVSRNLCFCTRSLHRVPCSRCSWAVEFSIEASPAFRNSLDHSRKILHCLRFLPKKLQETELRTNTSFVSIIHPKHLTLLKRIQDTLASSLWLHSVPTNLVWFWSMCHIRLQHHEMVIGCWSSGIVQPAKCFSINHALPVPNIELCIMASIVWDRAVGCTSSAESNRKMLPSLQEEATQQLAFWS